MKNVFAVFITSFALSMAFGATKTVTCVGPVGGKLSSLTGVLETTLHPSGQQSVKGTVQLNGGGALEVIGVYDNAGGLEYAALGTVKASKVDMVYISFNDNSNEALSYAEVSGKRLPLNCEGSK